ncbi:hypothetical protein DM01DRAFT_1083545 [Hesseltinella vesiculosa]|uniref:Uncharacterized protein n=1 Tax=Hesseltinella vesiculosa TaxID=101127 RepID=A0A1X2GE72_9FUNG|nr:hypothetical protein DM01DRAFT_1083545 [Hesseltinella vesiculosa]
MVPRLSVLGKVFLGPFLVISAFVLQKTTTLPSWHPSSVLQSAMPTLVGSQPAHGIDHDLNGLNLGWDALKVAKSKVQQDLPRGHHL